MDYKDQSLSIINGSSILTKEDTDTIATLQNELQDTFLHSQLFRTRTEMEVSVLDEIHFPTPDSKYWQSMREQNVHYTELVNLSYEYRKNNIEIKKLERDLNNEQDDLEQELLKIEIERKNFAKLVMERTAKDRIREIQQWHEIKQNLLPSLKYSLVDVDQHQLTSYTREFIREGMGVNEHTGIAEKNNILGKMLTVIKTCKEKGYWEDILKELTEGEKLFLKGNNLYD